MILSVACTRSEDQHTHEHDHDHGHEDAHARHNEENDHQDEVHLLPRQMEVMDIQLGHFQMLDLSETIKSNGRLELPPQNRAEVTSLWGGRISHVDVFPGRFVKKGQQLAAMEHPEFINEQENYLQAISSLDYLENEWKRKKALTQESISAQRELERAESEYLSAKAKSEASAAQLRMLGINVEDLMATGIAQEIPIQSPMSGFIRSIDVQTGSYVNPEQRMFEIVDNDHIHIDLKVFEKDVHKVELGQEVVFNLAARTDTVYRGKLFAIGKAFEESPRAMLVHAEIDNFDGSLLPGMYVEARIVTDKKSVQALPKEAVVRDGGLEYIFVLEEHGHDHSEPADHEEMVFKKVEVSTGARDLGYVEVVPADEIPKNAQIVTKGAFYLLAELNKGDGEHGHHH